MFRFLGLVISLLLVFSLIAVGQDNPKAEISVATSTPA